MRLPGATFLAAAHFVAVAVVAFLLSVFATFPRENQTAEEAAADNWLLVAALALAVLGGTFVIAVVTHGSALAAVALAGELAVFASVVIFANGESDNNDPQLIIIASAMAATAIAAAIVSRRPHAPVLASTPVSECFDVGQRVLVRTTTRTENRGVAGWHGTVVGRSHESNDPRAAVIAYAVAMDEAEELPWILAAHDVEALER